MKTFNQLTDSEVLNLSNEDLNDAIRLEAIDRGIQPPITLTEALRRSEWRGYTKPAEAIKVWTLKTGYHSSNFGFLDEQLAAKAIEGMICIEESSYSHPKIKITNDIPEVVLKYVGVDAGSQKAAKFKEFAQDDTEFNKVRDECLERYSKVCQDAYDSKVRQEKRSEYLRLSRGNEEIAKSFWVKVEAGEWPADTNGGAQ
jgi:hypothetical protein